MIEVGLGGRLDATNVVKPILSVITPVDFDHETFLGSSLEQIAGEKAGILKAGSRRGDRSAAAGGGECDQRRAAEVGAQLDFVRTDEFRNVQNRCAITVNSISVGCTCSCPLAGAHQVVNAATAAAALDEHLRIPPAGIEQARWPGRLEMVSRSPDIILDGAHNPAGARALAQHIRIFTPNVASG